MERLARNRLGFGGLLKIHQSSPGSRVLPPLKAWLWFLPNSYTPSLLLTVAVFSDLQDNSFSGFFRWWHNLFLNSCSHFILVRLFHDWVFLADGSGANTKQLSISHGGQQFKDFSCRKRVWVEPHHISYDWQQLPCTRKILIPF